MANNRVELATLPRYINVIPGKTSQSGLLLDTGTVAITFTDLSAANLAISDSSTWTDRLESNTLALITSGSNGSPELRIYVRGAARMNDSWVLLNVESVTVSDTTAAETNGTRVRTYTLTVDGEIAGQIPVATWAQDTTTQIPRNKLPDTTYGDQYFFPTTGDRNNRTNGTDQAGATVAPANIIWHPNDVAIVGTSSSRVAYVFIGADSDTARNTVDDDWLQLGQTTSLDNRDLYFSIQNNGGTLSINHTDSTSTSGGAVTNSALDLSSVMPAFSLPATYTLSVNGVQFIPTLDFAVTNGNVITFTNFVFAPPSGGDNDVVHIHGASI